MSIRVFDPNIFQNDVFQIGDGEQPPPPPTITVTDAGGVGTFPGAWRKRKKRPKVEALSELDELLVDVRALVTPYDERRNKLEQDRLRAALERAADLDLSDTLDKIEREVAFVQQLLDDIDEEEAVLLLM